MKLECKQKDILSLNWKTLEIGAEELEITLILQKGRFLQILFFKRDLKSI